MATTIQCDIVSAEDAIFTGPVKILIANAIEGEIGIESGHTPLLTALTPGPIRLIAEDGEESVYYVSGGYLEVQPYTITVLADTALRAGDMDEAAALAAKKEAEQAISDRAEGMDYSKAAAQLAEAAAQLRTLQQIRRQTR